MLNHLTIQNYAIIRKLSMDFSKGFSVITGETGSGKSIILGAMHMMLGQRADSQVMLDKSKKCIVEGAFDVENLKLQPFFEENDIDYDDECIIRREISPAGKSRAFINDTPVTLSTLKHISEKLIDIHSQLKNGELERNEFQRMVIDHASNATRELQHYAVAYKQYVNINKAIKNLMLEKQAMAEESDFLTFQYEELKNAKIEPEEEVELEHEQQLLSNAEALQENLDAVNLLLDTEETGVLNALREAQKNTAKLTELLPEAQELNTRLESTYFELKDISEETYKLSSSIEHNPERLAFINERLSTLFTLKQKHRKENIAELIELRDSLAKKLEVAFNIDDTISEKEKERLVIIEELEKRCTKLSAKRSKSFSAIAKYLNSNIALLGMPNAEIRVSHNPLSDFAPHGKEDVFFEISSNKGSEFQPIGSVASGGEKSRIMLVLKSLLAKKKQLPTIIFDEIDTGVSGAIANKLGTLMQELGKVMQVFSISHLPQVAAQGSMHYKVLKTDKTDGTETSIIALSEEERITEIAELLSGENPSEAAMENARELLQVN